MWFFFVVLVVRRPLNLGHQERDHNLENSPCRFGAIVGKHSPFSERSIPRAQPSGTEAALNCVAAQLDTHKIEAGTEKKLGRFRV